MKTRSRGSTAQTPHDDPTKALRACRRELRHVREQIGLFRRIAEETGEVYWVGSHDWREVHFVSRDYERVWGRSRESLYEAPLSWLDSVHPDDRPAVEAALARKASGDDPEPDFPLYRVVHADGSRRWIHARAFPIRNARGRVTQVAGIAQDVTAQRRDEESLHRAREFADSIIANAQAIILILDLEGRIVHFNPYMEALSGWPLGEARGVLWFDEFLPARDRAHIRRYFGQAIGGQSVRGHVNPIVTRDGRERMIEWYGHVLTDRAGEATALLSVGHDITERLAAEAALRAAHDELERRVAERSRELVEANRSLERSRARLRAVLDAEPECVKLVARDGTLVDMNRAGLEMIEAESLDQVRATCLDPLVSVEHREAFRALTEAAFRRESGGLEFEIVGLKGTSRWLDTRVVPLNAPDGGVEAALSVTRDVTERRRMEASLRESEALFRAAFEQAAVGMVLCDLDGRFEMVNDVFCMIAGYSREELLASDFRAITHPDDLSSDVEAYEALLAGRVETYAIEKRYVRKDGSQVWVALTVSACRHANRPTQLLGVVSDIGRRKAAEAALRESEARYRGLVETMNEGLGVFSADAKVRYANPALARMLGYSLEELMGKDVLDFFEGESRRLMTGDLQARRHGKAVPFEAEVTRKDGSHFAATISPRVLEDDDGNFRGSFAVLADVSGRRRVESELRAAEALYRTLFEQLPDAVMVLDPVTTRPVRFNPAAPALLGYADEEFARLEVARHEATESPAEVAEHVQRLLEEGRSDFDTRLRRRDGLLLDARVSARVVNLPSGPAIHSVIRDVTPSKRLERELRESLEEKEALLREVHHRVKNNLQVVSSLLSLQARRSSDPMVRGVLDDSHRRVESMALVHETLYQAANMSQVDLNDYFARLTRGIAATQKIGPEQTRLVTRIDPVSLRMELAVPCGLIVNELVTNAIKHAFPGDRRGTVTVTFQVTGGSYHLAVSDDGVGFAERAQETQPGPLGLRLVELLAQQIGGAMRIERSSGTRVEIGFPIERAVSSGGAEG